MRREIVEGVVTERCGWFNGSVVLGIADAQPNHAINRFFHYTFPLSQSILQLKYL